MHRFQHRPHFAHSPSVRTRVAAAPRQDHKASLTVAYALASAIVVTWMIYLSAITGSILPN